MSDDEGRDIDVEDDQELLGEGSQGGLTDNKRALHNAMERKRRDSIKDSFRGLQDCIPTLRGDKTSRAQVLKKTSDYISQMQVKIEKHQVEINDLKEQNSQLEAQIRALEKAKTSFGGPLIRSDSLLGPEIDLNTQDVIFGESSSDASLFNQDIIYEDSSSENSDSTHTLPQINLVSGGVVKTISSVTLGPSAAASAVVRSSSSSSAATAIPPGSVTIPASTVVALGGGTTVTLTPALSAVNSVVSTPTPPVVTNAAGGSTSNNTGTTAATTAAASAAITIAPGQSLLHSSIRVQPGQSLLLSEPLRKKKRMN